MRLTKPCVGGAIFILAMGITACPERNKAVWIAPTSSSQRIVALFGPEVGTRRNVQIVDLTVSRCYPRGKENPVDVRWHVFSTVGEHPLDSVVVGEVPSGFREDIRRDFHEPGCYFVAAGASVYTSFYLSPDGRVTAR